MKVSIVGYGFVGRGQARLLALDSRLEVTPWDPPAGRGNDQHLRRLEMCNLAIVCVPTPMGVRGECDTVYVRSALQHIAEVNSGCLVLLRSTVPPGTTDVLAAETGLGDRLHFSPEFVVERTGEDARDRVIVGGPRAHEVLRFFERALPSEAARVVVTRTEAEMVKYMTNVALAAKVALSSALSDMCDHYGLDYPRMRELWLMDERIGRSHTMVFTDDRGFGGKCLPKDTWALLREAEMSDPGLSGLLRAVLGYSQSIPEDPS